MKRIIRKSVERVVEKVGHKILNKDIMPIGIDLQRDIALNTKLSDVKMVFDIGAHNGVMSCYFREAFPSSTVYSFEPISSTYAGLLQNTKQDKSIHPINVGMSDKSGEVTVFLQSDSGLNSLNDTMNIPDDKASGKEEKVSVSTVGEFCQEKGIGRIDLLKTDTEGLDLRVLKGGESLIKAGKIDYILVEVGFNEDNKRNTPFEEVRKYLLGYGYKLRGFYDQSDFWNKQAMDTANALFYLQKK